MKKLILFLIITLIFISDVSAQNKFITKAEYDDALKKAAQKQNSIPRRITGVINFYDAKKVIYEKRTSIDEYISSDNFRNVSATEKNGKIVKQYESIRIGNMQYTKSGDESWKKQDLSKTNESGGIMFTGKTIEKQSLEEFLIIPTILDNKAVNVYFHLEVDKLEGNDYLTFIESRNSISKEGLTLLWTYKVSNGVPENISHISTTTYEYNPKDLKIEAPIK